MTQQVTIAWMLSKPRVLPMIATSSVQQLESDLAALDLKLSDYQIAWLDAADD